MTRGSGTNWTGARRRPPSGRRNGASWKIKFNRLKRNSPSSGARMWCRPPPVCLPDRQGPRRKPFERCKPNSANFSRRWPPCRTAPRIQTNSWALVSRPLTIKSPSSMTWSSKPHGPPGARMRTLPSPSRYLQATLSRWTERNALIRQDAHIMLAGLGIKELLLKDLRQKVRKHRMDDIDQLKDARRQSWTSWEERMKRLETWMAEAALLQNATANVVAWKK